MWRPMWRTYANSQLCSLKEAAVRNDDGLLRSTTGRAHSLYLLDDIHAINDLSKDHMAAIEPRGLHCGDEELEPFVFGPALAMLKMPGPVCLSLKFSSANLAP